MRDLIKYPEWQPEYFSAVMEGNVVQLPQKLLWAEFAIFNRHQVLVTGNGKDSAEELNALADAIQELRALKTTKLDHPGWK